MRAKRRTLLLLLLLAVLAGAALAALRLFNERAERAASEAEEGSIPLSSFAVDSLQSIEYTWQGETVRLLYAGDGWALADDPAYHLDQTLCDSMAAALADLRARRQLEPGQGEDYGLGDPLLTVTVTAAGESSTFAFGDTNGITGDIYLQKAGESAVYTAAASKADCFHYGKAEFFEPFSPAGLTASSLERISYRYGMGAEAFTVELNKLSVPDGTDEEGQAAYTTAWRLAAEPDAALDESAVQAILSALGGYVSGQITGTSPADYGFGQPLVTVTASDGAESRTLYYAVGAGGCYLMVEGDSSVYTVDLTVPDAFRRTAVELKAAPEGAGENTEQTE